MSFSKYTKMPLSDKEVRQLIKVFKKASREVRDIIDSIINSDFPTEAFVKVKLSEIELIISGLEKDSIEWLEENIPNYAELGAAEVLLSLGVTKDLEEAKGLTKLSKSRSKLITRRLNLAKGDILKGIGNSHNEIAKTVRRVAGKVLVDQYATGFQNINETKASMKEELRKEMDSIRKPYVISRSGKRWNIEDYADMLARTHLANTHIEHSVARGEELGCNLGVISTHSGTTDACQYHQGRIVRLTPKGNSKYAYWEDLRGQIFHPRCRHRISPIYSVDDLDAEEYIEAEKQRILGERALKVKSKNGTIVQNPGLLQKKVNANLPDITDDRIPEPSGRERLQKILKRNGIDPSLI